MHDDPTFVTESLTLIEGIFSLPAAIILAKLWTPVVVSSESPLIPETEIQLLVNFAFHIHFL